MPILHQRIAKVNMRGIYKKTLIYIVKKSLYIRYFKKKSRLYMIYDDKKFIGKIIKNARKSAKLTQAELAEKIDMSEKNLGNIENGKQFPQINNFFRILEVLNLSVEDFGVNQKEKSDKIRKDLIQSIYLLNDTELEIYLNILKYISQLTYKNLR